MAVWLLSVAGIAILSVLADTILPNGQTRKYAKTVIGLAVTLTVCLPVFSIVGSPLQIQLPTASVQPGQEHLQYLQNLREEDCQKLAQALQKAGFQKPTVTFHQTSRSYRATLSENFSQESYLLASQAAHNAGFSAVQFVWADG